MSGQQSGDDDKAKELVSYGKTQQYFNYLFAINSLAIIGGLTRGNRWVSKYQIQTLYALRNQPLLREGRAHHMMSDHSGTGRYQGPQYNFVKLGSAMSRALIIDQLVDHGWLTRRPNSHNDPRTSLLVSAQGHEFLQQLHPGCEDPDLPFRLHDWAQKGFEGSQESVDRYIRTYFGRQKRFMGSRTGR